MQIQLDVGGEDLEEEDKYLLEINLDDLDNTSGEAQECWLLAVKAAKESLKLKVTKEKTTEAA